MTTKLVPIYRTEAEKYFVPRSLVPGATIEINGVAVPTQPLAFGQGFDLLGISMAEDSLEGAFDRIDPVISLHSVWLHLPAIGRVVQLAIPAGEPVASAAVQGPRRGQLTLNYLGYLRIDEVETIDDWKRCLPTPTFVTLTVTGTIDIDSGQTCLRAEKPFFPRERTMTPEQEASFNKVLANATFIGYALLATRSNSRNH